MKKYLIITIMFFSLMFISGCESRDLPKLVEGKEKVTVYLFRMQECSHCADELQFLESSLKKYGDYFDVITYESARNANNRKLLDRVANELDTEFDGYPVTVIGNYSIGGFGGDMGEQLLDKIFSEYENGNHVDIVKSVLDQVEELKPTTVDEAMIEEGLKKENETKASSPKETGIVIGIFSVVILGFSALIFFSTRKK